MIQLRRGMSPWWPLQGLLSWCTIFFKSSNWNSFEDLVPVDFICRCPTFTCVSETWLHVWVTELLPWQWLPNELPYSTYRQVSDIRRTLVGNKIVDHSDVVGSSPVGAAPTSSSFSTWQLASLVWAKATARRDEKRLSLTIWCVLY